MKIAHASCPLPRISVIIPTRNEASTLPRLWTRLGRSDVYEVLVVDGHSTDNTVEVAARHGARVLSSVPSRGVQLNIGARAARGDLLFFLHADTLPPPDFVDHIIRTLDQPGVCAGAFGLSIDAPDLAFRWIERIVGLRGRWRRLPYGDQGIFLRKDVWQRVGGFPDISIMEDYLFMRRMRRLGRIPIVDAAVVTSARRWQQHGIWRTTLKNQLCIAAFRLGIDPDRLARWRNGPSPRRGAP